jgi:hypothetical protein
MGDYAGAQNTTAWLTINQPVGPRQLLQRLGPDAGQDLALLECDVEDEATMDVHGGGRTCS